MKNLIRKFIEQATAASPVTSTRLIEKVREETGKVLEARTVRKYIESLRRDDKLPILATRSGLQGYYIAQSVGEVLIYEREVRSHALRELKTIADIKADYFGQTQQELLFL